MLVALSIRDVVLIDRLDLALGPGLTALTGETGAGKSILLDSLGLALGARSEAGLVRAGATQAVVSAVFEPPADHPARRLLAEHGLPDETALTLRRVVQTDGRSRAFVNDEPVSVSLLKRLGESLVEIEGQFAQVGLADAGTHASLLDAFGGLEGEAERVRGAFAAWRAAERARADAEAAIAAARRDEEWLRHAVAELDRLAPKAEEEERLDRLRRSLQGAEKRAEALASARDELARNRGVAQALRSAARSLERLGEDAAVAPVLAALSAAQDAVAEAETLLERLLADSAPDPRALEAAEERLFALRAVARKHQVTVAELPALRDNLCERMRELDLGEERIAALADAARAAREAYRTAAEHLSAARREAAEALAQAVAKELAPLKLERARFVVELTRLEEDTWGPEGADRVQFLVAMNPGQAPAPLAKCASGGELSRLMLALKVVLARSTPVTTLVFDEVDAGIGGATAAAVGERLSRLAESLQVLVVTHSPQVAAKASRHWRVSKRAEHGMTRTGLEVLDAAARREEIARMLAGERITDAARAAAADLLAGVS
ncbi:DNA repair protein RecN [Elioraea thermophila]|uniref:DNA repair protein RecN n=1 Tax=Elioraea thermophila TaxID=2185104 RepID=UPI000DF43EB9|nr:DNA repair protein RecN [Elioraea thermophila]